MAKVELRRLVGQMRDARTGNVRNVGWNMDQLFLDGRQIATINRVPGSAVGLFPGVLLTAAERAEVVAAVAKERGGVKPVRVGGPIDVPYELLDDAEESEVVEEPTDVEVDDE